MFKLIDFFTKNSIIYFKFKLFFDFGQLIFSNEAGALANHPLSSPSHLRDYIHCQAG
jgi:hypothetical protein